MPFIGGVYHLPSGDNPPFPGQLISTNTLTAIIVDIANALNSIPILSNGTTGSGAVVLENAPTISGVPTLSSLISQSLATNGSGQIVAPARQSIGNQSPTGTTSTAARVMMGIGASFTFTPIATGDFLIFMQGSGSNTVAGSGFNARMAFGTGVAPTNGAAFTGTPFGPISQGSVVNANGEANAGIIAYRTGFVVGTTYWLDVSLEALVSGTASLIVQFNVIEL